ncbi:hypothetical protein NDU88_004580 [Pleurodeles waltl]|uniref:Uncharacterized protein n=1 Tax=Pleurodeles waltl TaxID=8319 RepID=A0AAV7LIN0_PLEWA|nr:hypothetical protein NDU88_004580 [Pleurodeles waltl]
MDRAALLITSPSSLLPPFSHQDDCCGVLLGELGLRTQAGVALPPPESCSESGEKPGCGAHLPGTHWIGGGPTGSDRGTEGRGEVDRCPSRGGRPGALLRRGECRGGLLEDGRVALRPLPPSLGGRTVARAGPRGGLKAARYC